MNTLKTLVLAGFAIIGITLIGIPLVSCQHEPELPPRWDTICFDKQIMPIIKTSCATDRCHNGGGEAPQFLEYADLVPRFVTKYKPVESKLHKVMLGHPNREGFMPPSNSPYKISSEQIDLITLWILEGAPYDPKCNKCDSSGSYSRTIVPLIDANCKSCHSGGSPAKGILLIDYQTITDAVNNNFLKESVNGGTGGHTPMPYKSQSLSPCNLYQINTWIDAKMPKN
jgi:hypothetical protein